MEIKPGSEITDGRAPRRRTPWWLVALLLAVLSVLPAAVGGEYYQHIAIFTLMYVVLGQSWNIVGGYAGQIALGNVVFLAIGAYSSAMMTIHFDWSPWLGMWLGVLISLIMSLVIGRATLHLVGHYFAMVTIALAEIARILVSNWKLMGSAQGITLPLKGASWYYMQWPSKITYYYIILAMAVLSTLLVMVLDRSRFGYYAKAVKMDEVAARNRGIDAYRIKQQAFSLNAAITSLVGTFFAQYVMYICPDSMLQISTSVLIAVIAIVGGLGTVTGPIIGAIFIFPLTEWLRALFGGMAMGVNFILFGVAVIFVVLVEPRGFHALFLRMQRFSRGLMERRGERGQ